MNEDLSVIGIFSVVVLIALGFILLPSADFFSYFGGVVKSVIEDVPSLTKNLRPLDIHSVSFNNISFGPQERLFVGQNFFITFDINFSGSPEFVNAKIVDCPLQGVLSASVESPKVVFDVFPTSSGLFSCTALVDYQTVDGSRQVKNHFTLPVYSQEPRPSFLWLVLAFIVILIFVFLIKRSKLFS